MTSGKFQILVTISFKMIISCDECVSSADIFNASNYEFTNLRMKDVNRNCCCSLLVLHFWLSLHHLKTSVQQRMFTVHLHDGCAKELNLVLVTASIFHHSHN